MRGNVVHRWSEQGLGETVILLVLLDAFLTAVLRQGGIETTHP